MLEEEFLPERLRAEAHVLGQTLSQLWARSLVYMGPYELATPFCQQARASVRVYVDTDIAPCEGFLGICSEPNALPIKSNSQCLVILVHTFEHHAQPIAILQECYRILKPNGNICVISANPYRMNNLPAVSTLWSGQESPQEISLQALSSRAESIGFETDKRLTSYIYPGQSWGMLPFFAQSYLWVARKHVIPLTAQKAQARARQRTWSEKQATPVTRVPVE